MYTRKDYLDKRCTHREYYAQFVDQWIREQVIHVVTLDYITRSRDEAFNDIPLHLWERVFPLPTIKMDQVMRKRGDYPTKAGLVCIAKEAARQIKDEQTGKFEGSEERA